MRTFRSFVKDQLLKRDMVVSRPPGQFNVSEYKLRALRARGFDVTCAVDGGAAVGGWARELREVYPECAVLCVEPRQDAQGQLEAAARELGNVFVEQTLLGPEEGEVEFNESDDQSSVLNDARGQRFGRTVRVRMSTLDGLIDRLKLPSPDLIKLDLQGFELEALKGATRCLQAAQALLLEVSFIRIQSGAPIAHEVIAWMHERGFVIYDIFALWQRPLDGALAQGDIMFLREGHALLADQRWSTSF